MTNGESLEGGTEGFSGERGWEQDQDKAMEVASQMNVAKSIAANMRGQAREVEGGKNIEQSKNPLVIELVKQANEFDQQAAGIQETAEANFDQRRALILESTKGLMEIVINVANNRSQKPPIAVSISPPVDKAAGLGISKEVFKREYLEMVCLSLGADIKEVDQALSEAKEEERGIKSAKTKIPNISIAAGKRSFADKEPSLYIRIEK